MKPYLVTRETQTWDCNKYKIYKLNDKNTWYIDIADSDRGYKVEDFPRLGSSVSWVFDDIESAKRKLALIEYNSISYCKVMYREPAFFALEEPREGSFVCECGTHLIVREYGDTSNDDGVPLDDEVVIRGVCLCGKKHSFERKVKVEITVKYERMP